MSETRLLTLGVLVWGGLAAQALAAVPAVLLETEVGDRSALSLELHAGDYEVRRSADHRLRVMEIREGEATGRATLTHISSKGGRMELDVDPPDGDHGNHGRVHVILEVPACGQMAAALTAGRLQVNSTPCDDTSYTMHAGELVANLREPAQYREVKATVSIGQVAASAFDPDGKGEHGGFFPTYRWQGPGARRFVAHVGTGEIRLAR